jgi:hypothetical protein
MEWNDLVTTDIGMPTNFTDPAVILKYRKQLQAEILSVSFLKKDNTKRTMVCTLKPDLLPNVTISTNNTLIVPANPRIYDANTLCVVFDMEKQSWRSFRWDSVHRITNP